MLIFWSLVRNSVVLAVYLLFSVACFFTVHEHYSTAYCVPDGQRYAVKYFPSNEKLDDVWAGIKVAKTWGWLDETTDGWVWDNAPGINIGPGDPEVFMWKTEGKSVKVAFAYWLSEIIDKRIKVKDLQQK